MLRRNRFRTRLTKEMPLGFFAAFKELRHRGCSLSFGEVRPADVQFERDAWAEHFRLIGEGPGLVVDGV